MSKYFVLLVFQMCIVCTLSITSTHRHLFFFALHHYGGIICLQHQPDDSEQTILPDCLIQPHIWAFVSLHYTCFICYLFSNHRINRINIRMRCRKFLKEKGDLFHISCRPLIMIIFIR